MESLFVLPWFRRYASCFSYPIEIFSVSGTMAVPQPNPVFRRSFLLDVHGSCQATHLIGNLAHGLASYTSLPHLEDSILRFPALLSLLTREGGTVIVPHGVLQRAWKVGAPSLLGHTLNLVSITPRYCAGVASTDWYAHRLSITRIRILAPWRLLSQVEHGIRADSIKLARPFFSLRSSWIPKKHTPPSATGDVSLQSLSPDSQQPLTPGSVSLPDPHSMSAPSTGSTFLMERTRLPSPVKWALVAIERLPTVYSLSIMHAFLPFIALLLLKVTLAVPLPRETSIGRVHIPRDDFEDLVVYIRSPGKSGGQQTVQQNKGASAKSRQPSPAKAKSHQPVPAPETKGKAGQQAPPVRSPKPVPGKAFEPAHAQPPKPGPAESPKPVAGKDAQSVPAKADKPANAWGSVPKAVFQPLQQAQPAPAQSPKPKSAKAPQKGIEVHLDKQAHEDIENMAPNDAKKAEELKTLHKEIVGHAFQNDPDFRDHPDLKKADSVRVIRGMHTGGINGAAEAHITGVALTSPDKRIRYTDRSGTRTRLLHIPVDLDRLSPEDRKRVPHIGPQV
ncbi:hypothetical protein NMY22_g13782 [Coprinellus aureogranulatus]|nr:hypothetical protein NMY22_g13782 [Coprinellus aureogranulatus]